MEQPYRFTYPVYSFLTDHNNKLTAANLANFLQDIAGRNAHELGWAVSDLHNRGKTWVLSRLYVEIDELPAYQDELIIETWPTGGERLFAYRDFKVLNSAEKIIAKSRSSWIVMDLNTRRPEFVPDDVKKMKDKYPPSIIDIPVGKVSGCKSTDNSRPMKVRRSDLDVNRHVNNVKFLEWGFEALDDEFYVHHQLKSMDIIFKAEVLHTDSIISSVQKDGMQTHHTIYKDDVKPVCVMRVKWNKV